ncbi:hypothetical protein BJ878DRAFT_290756 [Calycina marina]|uniref:Uncharacterized protein n=1 Tax=Calycina marina TaxID=1763456 RepID=A0A9P7YVH7_9HELO|nr:hypothetical protein BJ878DRAFT_290756 [Calycina marina]
MIEQFKLPVGKRQFQRKLRARTKGGRRFKCAFVKKVVSTKNRGGGAREAYGWEHGDKSLDNLWAYDVFTDKTHIDSGSQAVGDILREEGTRYDPENGSHVKGASSTSLLRSHGGGSQSFSSITMKKITKSVLPTLRSLVVVLRLKVWKNVTLVFKNGALANLKTSRSRLKAAM